VNGGRRGQIGVRKGTNQGWASGLLANREEEISEVDLAERHEDVALPDADAAHMEQRHLLDIRVLVA
jgi:hypothetical protein